MRSAISSAPAANLAVVLLPVTLTVLACATVLAAAAGLVTARDLRAGITLFVLAGLTELAVELVEEADTIQDRTQTLADAILPMTRPSNVQQLALFGD